MILGAKDWIGNFAMDTLNRIFINILDNMVYMLIGFAYKVYLMIASIDLFNNYNTGTENVHEIYTELTSRIYSVLAIVVMFVLAYQIIIFIIDPDKGMKQSKQLIVNLVKAIIMVVLAPLVFHYMAQIQYHVLISDNVIWRLVLGEGGSQSSDVTGGGNTMASMVFMSLYHPVGTQYSDFYDNDGTLKSYNEACAFYKGGNMSKDTLAKVIRGGTGGAGVGAAIGAAGFLGFGALPGAVAGGIAGAGTALITSLLEEDTTACQFYYRQLYIGDGKVNGSDFNIKPNEINTVTDYGDRTVGSSNKTLVLASVPALADEVYQEGNMEYYYFSSVAGALILYLLVAYVLDIAYRAFKLAFLQMVAPIPILLGVIPKNEKIYSQWKDSFIKTYLDIFVRVFVMAFVILMIKLLPSFVGAMYTVLSAGGDTEASGILKAVTMVAMIIGLLRFGKELPEMIKDVAKNGPGLLSGIDLNPNNSFKKTKEGIQFGKDLVGKPLGAAAGAMLGARSARKTVGGRNANFFNRQLAALRGIQTGGKIGYQNGLKKGTLTNAMVQSNAIAQNDLQERKDRVKGFRKIPGDYSTFRSRGDNRIKAAWKTVYEGEFLNNMTQGRMGKFISASRGSTIGAESQIIYAAGQAYQKAANGILDYFAGATKDAKADIQNWNRASESTIKYNEDTHQWEGKWNGIEVFGQHESEIRKQIKSLGDEYLKRKEVETFDGKLELLGTKGMQNIADSLLSVNSQYFDSLGAYPGLQQKIQKASLEGAKDANFTAANSFLESLNGGKTIDYEEVDDVMKLLNSQEFEDRLATQSNADDIRKGVATYYRSVVKAMDGVQGGIQNVKGGLEGTEVSYNFNTSVNNLGKKPGEQ